MSARRERRDGKKLLIDLIEMRSIAAMPRREAGSAIRPERERRGCSRVAPVKTVKPRLSRAGTRAIPAHMQVATRARSSFGASGASD